MDTGPVKLRRSAEVQPHERGPHGTPRLWSHAKPPHERGLCSLPVPAKARIGALCCWTNVKIAFGLRLWGGLLRRGAGQAPQTGALLFGEAGQEPGRRALMLDERKAAFGLRLWVLNASARRRAGPIDGDFLRRPKKIEPTGEGGLKVNLRRSWPGGASRDAPSFRRAPGSEPGLLDEFLGGVAWPRRAARPS